MCCQDDQPCHHHLVFHCYCHHLCDSCLLRLRALADIYNFMNPHLAGVVCFISVSQLVLITIGTRRLSWPYCPALALY